MKDWAEVGVYSLLVFILDIPGVPRNVSNGLT